MIKPNNPFSSPWRFWLYWESFKWLCLHKQQFTICF